jgi:hypothetical protein
VPSFLRCTSTLCKFPLEFILLHFQIHFHSVSCLHWSNLSFPSYFQYPSSHHLYCLYFLTHSWFPPHFLHNNKCTAFLMLVIFLPFFSYLNLQFYCPHFLSLLQNNLVSAAWIFFGSQSFHWTQKCSQEHILNIAYLWYISVWHAFLKDLLLSF